MTVSVQLVLPIKAVPIDEHYGLNEKEYEVKDIRMGQSSTSIELVGIDKIFNSVHFKFMLHDKEIDIYNSGLINNYRTLNLKGICYKE